MESREHAEARGAKPYARLTKVVADLAQRKQPGAVTKSLEALWSKLGVAGDDGNLITGATGVEPVTSEEKAFLRQHPGFAVRATGTMFGHTMEAQFPLGLALAALSISRGALFPPNDPTGLEVEKTGAPTQIVVRGGRSLAGRRHGAGRGDQAVTAEIDGEIMTAPRDKFGRPIVVVTGMGVVTSLGAGKTDNWTKLTAGESGIRTMTRFPIDGLKTTMAGTVDFVTVDPSPRPA